MHLQRLLIELGNEPVGIAICEGKRFRFYASHADVQKLDKAVFASPGAIENACRELSTSSARKRLGSFPLLQRRDIHRARGELR